MSINISVIKYKYRFFILYIIIGLLSILFEIAVHSLLKKIFENLFFSSFIAVLFGVITSFWLNIKYNFKISKAKRNQALIYFLTISFLSYFLQIFIIDKIQTNFNYEFTRILVSGCVFWIAYFFHSKYSFKDYKKVGVAVYANGVEDVNNIFDKVEDFPDFIHVDIVDKTMNKHSNEVLTYKTEVIKAFWNKKIIEAHIMSRKPINWISKIVTNIDRIYVHIDIDEDLNEVLSLIKKHNRQAGIVVQKESDLKFFEKYHNLIDSILVLAIEKPGHSGQLFKNECLELISKINKHKYRKRISLNVDGGVNNTNVSSIDSENVISGSYVLKSSNPIKNIIVLQTSSQYEPF